MELAVVSAAPATIFTVYLQLHHKRLLHMELEFHCISSKLSYCGAVPVIAVLASNELETERAFCDESIPY
jgi:hypothetical protein